MDFVGMIFAELQRTDRMETPERVELAHEQLDRLADQLKEAAAEIDGLTGELINGYLEAGFRKGFEVAKALYK